MRTQLNERLVDYFGNGDKSRIFESILRESLFADVDLPEDTAWDQGYEEFDGDYDVDKHNPYPKGSKEWQSYKDGWDAAWDDNETL